MMGQQGASTAQKQQLQQMRRVLPVIAAGIACVILVFVSFRSHVLSPVSLELQSAKGHGGLTTEKLYTQINILTPPGKGARKAQGENPVSAYMGGYAVPIPAGSNRAAFPYPQFPPAKKIDTSKFVLRSEEDDRFKQMESRMKTDEKVILSLKKTIENLKAKKAK
mmetsp:Transcript_19710/g.40195  ORF Transcript_19710/g.40195 Transcript_19710/m.40195 type:complete len:165 (-) Transcript_19710:71-565(-)|eukprot:CAMPEP_0181291706 /NCGR_PEP_ID=MMETSP1101-20121128/2113_1 /TAXON_ID=46948 /ORGANISM="Rhodomonas abbreviata, Strain Caron Lab Isolate" /LENGTH=164 /DNA_ID=CAMNT_0023396121 /DNA_START=1 /DNA_END=495 /DNA_ORIENTATION=-